MLDALAQGSARRSFVRGALFGLHDSLWSVSFAVIGVPLARARGPWVTSWSIGVASADIDGTLRSCFRRGELCAGEGGVPVVFVCCMLTGCSVECAHSVGGVASPGAAHDRCGCVS